MYDPRSPEALAYRKLYFSVRWRKIRAAQLASYPLCQWCKREGRITAATVCHHENPKSKLNPATFYAGPFTSLCADHHDIEAKGIEARGFSKQVGLDGWPTDPKHPAYSE